MTRTRMLRISALLMALAAALAFLAFADRPDDLTPSARAALAPCDEVDYPFPLEPLPSLGELEVAEMVNGLSSPTSVAFHPADGRIFVSLRHGPIVELTDTGPVLAADLGMDTSHEIESDRGLLTLAFSPAGTELYTLRTDDRGDSLVTAVDYRAGELVMPEHEILRLTQPDRFHNGGGLAFGPDGYLYVSMGDGGDPLGDEAGNAQNPRVLLGKVWRIDPRPGQDPAYSIPADNPFVGSRDAAPEIWATGLRNPFRLSLDPVTGDLWVSDVGEACWEEITRVPADEAGANLGWDRVEGSHVFEGPPPPDHIAPVHEWPYTVGCAAVGGFVYRGDDIPQLAGHYLFTDWCHGRIQAISPDGRAFDLGVSIAQPLDIRPGPDGEPWVVSMAGAVLRLKPVAGAATTTAAAPP